MVRAADVGSELVERAGDLKRELVEFSERSRFSKEFRKAMAAHFGQTLVESDEQLIEFMDWFILQHRLADGQTVVEQFAAARTGLTDGERQLLLSWRDVVEGVFEIGQRDGIALLALNLIDDLTYRMYSNSGPAALKSMRRGNFMIGRLVPMGDDWMLSGIQRVYPASDRKEIFKLAGKLSLQLPAQVFRNPEKLAQGWELQRSDRQQFIEWFGTDLVVVAGSELRDRHDAYWQWRVRQTAYGEIPVGSAPDAPRFEFPEHLLEAETVALIYDEEEGFTILAEFGLVQEVFEDPRLLADRDHRSAIVHYLNDDSISPLPFRRLARSNPAKASEVFRRLLKKPTFSWERDGEELLRHRKASFFAKPVLPSVVPAPQDRRGARR